MMKSHSAKKELILLPILLIVIILCVAGHFLLQASFADSNLTEYLLAALPFAMFGFVIIAFKIASKSEDKERQEQSDND
jgi:undecaprenyl pyrophosphate phosphatase UppP